MPESPRKPFELEPEDPRPERAPSPPPPPPPPPTTTTTALPTATPASPGNAPAPGDEKPEVDTRTFAEKHGRAVERVAGPRPPPPDWPREALSYPVRGAGGVYLLGCAAALVALDLLVWSPGLTFLSWLLKLPALLFVLRWEIDLVGMTAAGRDEPVGFLRALALDRDGIAALRRLLLGLAITSSPLWVSHLLDDVLGLASFSRGLVLAGATLGSLWFAVIAVGVAVSEPRLARPWTTVGWILRHPFALLVGSLGWWALALVEVALAALASGGGWAGVPAGIGLRLASVYALMVSARALGVVGRAV